MIIKLQGRVLLGTCWFWLSEFVHTFINSFDYVIFIFNEESSRFLAVKRFTSSTFEFASLRRVLIRCHDYITDHMGDVYKDLSKC